MLRLAFDFIITWRETRTRPNAYVKKMGYQGIGFTCGGFVHQTAMNRMHYYPDWVDKMNLRFVYRMYKEKHTRTRYLQAAFLFPVRFIGERIFG